MAKTFATVSSALLVVAVVVGCRWQQERICKTGEMVVDDAVAPGRWCAQPRPGDLTCPDDQIPRRFQASGREECIPNIQPPPSG